MRYKFITRAHAKLDPPTNFSRSCWKPLWARVALLMSVFDPDAPPPGSCDLKHIIYSWTNSDWRVFPRIPTLTVKVAQNSSATLQQWEVVDETQSRCYTHTHTLWDAFIWGGGGLQLWLEGFLPSPLGNESETAPPDPTNGVEALLQLTANQNHFLSANALSLSLSTCAEPQTPTCSEADRYKYLGPWDFLIHSLF